MHVIVGGFGRVGRHLARVLESQGHSVTVIDHDPRAFAEHGESIQGRKLTGEVFDRETLVKAGIERADAFAAVTAGDNSNIVSARIARERFGVPCVVARIFDPRRAAIYERFGIPTVSSVQWAGAQLVAMIIEPNLRLASVYGGGEVVTVSADVPLRLTGRKIADLEYPGKFTVSALVRGGAAVLPSGRLEVVKGDRIYVTVTRDALGELKKLLELQ
ncbi:MAG TPA: TrkA family potassium uptake protein [Coriobacteriia bacterium]|nr:TrkA family potassium uptake protein [Coriobacteriia bacterium]